MPSAILTTPASYIPRTRHILGLLSVLSGSLLGIWLQHQIDVFSHGQIVGLSALTLAIVIGMLLGNTLYPKLAPRLAAGVNFAKGQLLRLAIMLYGFKLTLGQVANVGTPAILIDALVLISTFILTYWLGTRWLKVDRQTSLLIGAGTSICGAAAVIAAEPVIKAEAHKVTIAVATVVVFGTLAMILYPVLYHVGWLQPWLTAQQYGLYTGSTIHEVAQVVVAGDAITAEVGHIAVVTKMIRVMMLAPFLLALSFWLAPKAIDQPTTAPHTFTARLAGVQVPWFAFIFIAIVGLHSLLSLPEWFVTLMVRLDDVLLGMAMFALGLTTHLRAIKQAGIRPLLLGAIMFAWLLLGGGMINVALAYI